MLNDTFGNGIWCKNASRNKCQSFHSFESFPIHKIQNKTTKCHKWIFSFQNQNKNNILQLQMDLNWTKKSSKNWILSKFYIWKNISNFVFARNSFTIRSCSWLELLQIVKSKFKIFYFCKTRQNCRIFFLKHNFCFWFWN